MCTCIKLLCFAILMCLCVHDHHNLFIHEILTKIFDIMYVVLYNNIYSLGCILRHLPRIRTHSTTIYLVGGGGGNQ